MPSSLRPFRTHIFSFEPTDLAMHKNLMPCVIFGRAGPVIVTDGQSTTQSEIICIKPDTLHQVSIGEGGAEIVYFDGMQLPQDQSGFAPLNDCHSAIPNAVKTKDVDAIAAFKAELSGSRVDPDPAVMEIVHQLYAAPMIRLSQHDLSKQLGLERTQALRHFKWNTGQTFRKFKIWAASIATVNSILSGQTIGAAGIDSGFSDAAHVARTARTIFGVTPSNGIGNLTGFMSV